MPTFQKRAQGAPAGIKKSAEQRPPKRHAVPTSRGEKHLGATEAQVSVTMPPKADDDEPKQG